MITNYYETLKLTPKATKLEVAENYRKLALRYHPKSSRESQEVAEQMFNACAEAYEVLSDPVKRAYYDKHGHEALKEGLFNQGQLKGGYRFGNNAEEIFECFFKNSEEMNKVLDVSVKTGGGLFGHAFGGLNAKPALGCETLIVKVPCTLEELYTGTSKMVNYNRKTLNSDGRTTSMQLCSKTIKIKPGYGCKTMLQFPGEGHQTVHGTTSNLVFCVEEIPHMNFKRKGDDLIYSQWVTLADSLQCSSIEVGTLDGRKISVSVDSLVKYLSIYFSPKSLQEIEGEGMRNQCTGKRGSLFIKFEITFPEQISEQVRKQLRCLLC